MESFQQSEKDPIIAELDKWKNGPTILASSSDFRRNQLEDYGFSNVETAYPIPEKVELDLASELKEQGGAPANYFDSDGRNFSEHIAAAKVNHVIENQSPNAETLVIGFDTTPVIYDQATDEKNIGIPTTSEKYQNIEDARAGILEQFKVLSAGCTDLQKKIDHFTTVQKQIGGTQDDIDMTIRGQMFGQRQGKIYVNTGVAVAAPNEHDVISRLTDEVQLYSDAIAETNGDEQALEVLVENIIESQGEEKTLSITGGVDYSDSYIRRELKIHEITLDDTTADESLYKGFPEQGIATVLQMRAREILQEAA